MATNDLALIRVRPCVCGVLLCVHAGIKLLLHLLAPHSARHFSAKDLEAIAVPVLHFEDGMCRLCVRVFGELDVNVGVGF